MFTVKLKVQKRSPWVDNFEVLRSSGALQRVRESEQRPLSEITRLSGGQANKRSKPVFPGSGSLQPPLLWSPPFFGPDGNSVYLTARGSAQYKDVRLSVKLYYFELHFSYAALPLRQAWLVLEDPPVWLVSFLLKKKQALRKLQGWFWASGPIRDWNNKVETSRR